VSGWQADRAHNGSLARGPGLGAHREREREPPSASQAPADNPRRRTPRHRGRRGQVGTSS